MFNVAIWYSLSLLSWMLLQSPLALAKQPKSFEEAKKIATIIWSGHAQTFYCGCRYNKFGIIDFNTCSYNQCDERAQKHIGWEHVVAVSWYGKNLSCWQEPICISAKGKRFKGRNCCKKIDPAFKKMESDLHNIVPVIREINRARSDFSFGEFYLKDKSKFTYRQCDLIIDERYHVVEPRDEIKGTIARIHFYMAEEYGLLFTEQQVRLYTDWHRRFPASAWEKEWNQKVAQYQGNLNHFIE